MSTPDWPTPATDPQQPQPQAPQQPAQRALPLPRVDDLPVAEQGYDREAVREAFDAFYRHAAQLDATLRTLEAVEVFQRTASELRAELRTVRAAGWTTGGGYASGGYGAARSGVREWSLPPAFPRVAAEALFLIVIGVIVGVAGWSRIAIVLVMALALAIVWLVEWVASRERAVPQAVAPPVPPQLDDEVVEDVPAELASGDAAGWSAFSQTEEGPEAMTMISAAEEVEAVPVDQVEQMALEDPVPVEPPVDDDPVPIEEPPDEDPVPVDEPAVEDELVAEAEPVVEVEEADAPAGDWPFASDPAPQLVVDEQPRRRFRLWRRRDAAPEPVVAEPEADPDIGTQSHELEPATEPEESASEEEFLS
ncbi:MAG TPA: hypothetical protein VE444_11225, partial [Gaiellaceae bacterium]|nr:hypothetical protein [Gaiellaceae bacterium]